MAIKYSKNDSEVVIKNIKLFTIEEEKAFIEKYKGAGPQDAPNGPTLRKHIEIASFYEDRSFITFDILVSTKINSVKSNFAIIIKYDERVELIYDIFNKITETQQKLIWGLRAEIIKSLSAKMQSRKSIFHDEGVYNNLKEYTLENYKEGGKAVFYCLIRNIFVLVTEEEKIRQGVLLSLLNESKIHPNYIKVEEHMSHYKKGGKDRADIVVIHPETQKPWILWELKSPNQPITDDTLNQAERYNKILYCKYICLFNGITEEWYVVKGTLIKQISKPETIDDLYDKNVKYYQEKKYIRPGIHEFNNEKVIKKHMYGKYAISEKTPKKAYSFILNLFGFFRENKSHIQFAYNTKDFIVVRDGTKKTSFSNAGGGQYDGVYRFFIIQLPNGENKIINMAIFDAGSKYTSLNIAIQDGEIASNVLQLQLDTFLVEKDNKWLVYHNGRGSRIKTKDVIEHCKNAIPDLVSANKIFLGELPKNELFDWENSKQFVINLIRYAIARNEFKHLIEK